MTRFLLTIFLRLAAVLLAGCSTVTKAPEGELPSSLRAPDTVVSATEADLTINSFDIVSVSVFGVEDLSGSYQVDFEGLVKMPLLGRVKAQGMTAPQFAKTLEARLGESYLQNPNVTARITSSRNEVITVDGAVENPGQYPVAGPMSLLQAITLSGGPTAASNAKRVAVFRTVNGERMVAGFNLQDIRAGKQVDPPVFGNDVIVVDGSEIKAAYQDFLNAIPLLSVFARF